MFGIYKSNDRSRQVEQKLCPFDFHVQYLDIKCIFGIENTQDKALREIGNTSKYFEYILAPGMDYYDRNPPCVLSYHALSL